jgi:hypothetical protein
MPRVNAIANNRELKQPTGQHSLHGSGSCYHFATQLPDTSRDTLTRRPDRTANIRQFEPAKTQVCPYKIAGRNIQRECPSRNVSKAIVQLRQYQTVVYVDAELVSASTSACMTAEATPRAARTGFRHALVSTTRHPDVDEPALAIPNRETTAPVRGTSPVGQCSNQWMGPVVSASTCSATLNQLPPFGSPSSKNPTCATGPSPAAISSSLFPIFSFRVWGHLGRGEGAQSCRPSAPLCLKIGHWLERYGAYNVSGVPPNAPNTPGTLGPGREFPFSRGLPLPIGTFGLDRSSVYPVCIPRVRANVFLFPEKEE